MPGHRLIGTTLAVVVIATLAACDGGDPMNPAPLQVPEPSLNIYIPPGPTSDVTLHILEINHPFKFFLSFTSPFTLRIPACPSGGCDYLYPSPTVTAGGVYPLGMVSPSGPQILVFRVLGCNPAYVNLCFYGATVGLGGDRYGFAFDPYSGEYDDLVFEVLYEPEDTLVVSLVLARDSVTPVIDRTFDP